jgi:hypothetical protein
MLSYSILAGMAADIVFVLRNGKIFRLCSLSYSILAGMAADSIRIRTARNGKMFPLSFILYTGRDGGR